MIEEFKKGFMFWVDKDMFLGAGLVAGFFTPTNSHRSAGKCHPHPIYLIQTPSSPRTHS